VLVCATASRKSASGWERARSSPHGDRVLLWGDVKSDANQMSPYSWFAAERIGALLPDAQWRPVFAGGVFKACGRVSWGLTADREVKLADCEARARAQGLGAIHWPDPWPTNYLPRKNS
jgi:hypothetical protein